MDAEAKIDSLVKGQPETQEVNLEYQALSNDEIVRLLPKLERLTNLRALNLSRNRLSALPKDLSGLRKLQVLDISSNFFQHISSAIDGLKTLPALVSLNLHVGSAEEEEMLFTHLPQLQQLNGVDLSADASGPGQAPRKPPRRQEVSMTQDDLKEVAVLYGAIRALRGKPDDEELTAELTRKFDDHIQSTMEELSQKMEGLKDPFLRQGEILLAKHQLYDICFEEIANAGAAKDPNFGKVLRTMRDVHSKLFAEFPGVLGEMRPHYLQRLADMQGEVVRAERETAQLLQAAEMLEKEAEAHSEQKEMMAEKFERERNRLIQENKRLREANSALSKRLGGRGAAGGGAGTPVKEDTRLSASAAYGGGMSGKLKNGEKASIRDLSLKQLKDHFNAIYTSKVTFDKKCADAHLPRETMEQHMYTYLNQKYGLRSLIIEHATGIVKAMHKFSAVDNDVAVFAKIYEGAVDEEFRFVQQRLKETVTELLRVYLKGKNPTKTDDKITVLLNKRLKGFVYGNEWQDIVKYMYNREDSLNLVVMVKDMIRTRPNSNAGSPGRGRPRPDAEKQAEVEALKSGKVKFSDFLHVLLQFQLSGHEKFLSKFRKIFRQFDTDSDGVIDENQFRQMVLTIDPGKTKVDLNKLVNMIDPYNNQHMTFSESVNVLSSELVSMMSGADAPSQGGYQGDYGAAA